MELGLDVLNELALNVLAAMEPVDDDVEDWEVLGPEVWARVTVNMQEYLLMPDRAFKMHFRMSQDVFKALVEMIRVHLHDDDELHKDTYDLSAVVLMVLWLLATPDRFRSVALRFGITPGVLHYHYKRIIGVLCDLSPVLVTWPSPEEREQLSATVEERTGFPGVVGAVDGSHIEIYTPYTDPQHYYNRHHDYSIVLQAVCDENLLFRDVYIGEPGAAHDSRVFRRSPLCSVLLEDEGLFLRNTEHIVGDGAYILTDKVLTPYRNNGNLTAAQVNFNNRLSSSRSVVERAFGLLKVKWRRLLFLSAHNMMYAVQTIAACVVLHNFMILNGDIEGEVDPPADLVNAGVELNDDDGVEDENVDHPEVVLERDHPLLANARILGAEERDDIRDRLPR